MNGYRPGTDECYRAANGRVLPDIRRWDGRTRRAKGVSRNVTRPRTAAKGRRPTETDHVSQALVRHSVFGAGRGRQQTGRAAVPSVFRAPSDDIEWAKGRQWPAWKAGTDATGDIPGAKEAVMCEFCTQHCDANVVLRRRPADDRDLCIARPADEA